ncbi:MAG: DUF488 domain-containing protein [Mucilaginibacter sp.]
MDNVVIKRIYEPADPSDGFRILVDRLWPRGMKKEDAGIDLWMKAVAPTDALRKWFHHDGGGWDEFRHKYVLELKDNPAVDELHSLVKEHKTVTLLYAAKDEMQNHALVLKEFFDL